MRRVIRKRVLRRDDMGRLISDVMEVLTDDGPRMEALTIELRPTCESCLRVLAPEDPRGVCDVCGAMTCHCSVSCGVCSRNLCGGCRRGVGQAGLVVCPECEPEVRHRMARERALAIEDAKLRLIHSSMLDRLPGAGILRQLGEFIILERLAEIEREDEPEPQVSYSGTPRRLPGVGALPRADALPILPEPAEIEEEEDPR